MDILFLLCAVLGGTVMLLQFAMALIGIGDDGADADLGEMAGDAADLGGDVDLDLDVDVDGAASQGQVTISEAADADIDHPSSSRLFGVISLRTIVAALAFFGMAGKAALAAQFDPMSSLLIAIAAGGAAMYGVYAMMRALYRLRSDGTVRIQHAVGRRGSVYLPIPARRQGSGKIQLNLQGRTVECQAVADEDATLPTGSAIEVVRVLGPDSVEVVPIAEECFFESV